MLKSSTERRRHHDAVVGAGARAAHHFRGDGGRGHVGQRTRYDFIDTRMSVLRHRRRAIAARRERRACPIRARSARHRTEHRGDLVRHHADKPSACRERTRSATTTTASANASDTTAHWRTRSGRNVAAVARDMAHRPEQDHHWHDRQNVARQLRRAHADSWARAKIASAARKARAAGVLID